MKTSGLILAAVLGLIGCGAAQEPTAPSVAGAWRFSLAATEAHPACDGRVVLTERGPGDSSVTGLAEGETYIDGLWTCADGSTGIMGGDRFGDSIDLALNAQAAGQYVIWARPTVDVTAETMIGDGFRAERE